MRKWGNGREEIVKKKERKRRREKKTYWIWIGVKVKKTRWRWIVESGESSESESRREEEGITEYIRSECERKSFFPSSLQCSTPTPNSTSKSLRFHTHITHTYSIFPYFLHSILSASSLSLSISNLFSYPWLSWKIMSWNNFFSLHKYLPTYYYLLCLHRAHFHRV